MPDKASMMIKDRLAREITGEVLFRGQDLLKLPEEEMRHIRGAKISMIFQDPLTALNPVHRVGNQIAEVFQAHRTISKKEAFEESINLLQLVGIPQPRQRARQGQRAGAGRVVDTASAGVSRARRQGDEDPRLLRPRACVRRSRRSGVGDVAGETMAPCQSSHATNEVAHPEGRVRAYF